MSSDPTGQQLGVHRQREDCEKLCRDKGWTPVEYRDNDTSATTGKRKHYERMLADIRDGLVRAVVVWDLDRLHRRPLELEGFMALADERGLKLATVSGDVDLSTAQGRLIARLKGSVAAHEIEHKRARQLRAAQQKAERGVPQWKRAFGFADGYVADEITAPLVKEMYAHVLAGGSLSGLARELNARGDWAWGQKWVKPKDDYGETIKSAEVVCQRQPWSASTLSLFLRSPRNAGLRTYNRELVLDKDGQPVRGAWEPLVDEDTWRAVQSVLDAPGRAPGRKSVRQHLLTGVLVCGKCEGSLAGQWVMQPTGGEPGRSKAGRVKEPTGQKRHVITYSCKTCRGVSMRAEHIEPLVYGVVGARLAEPDALDLLRSEQHDVEAAEQVRQQRSALNQRLLEIADERADGLLTGQQAARATARILDRLAALQLVDADQERLRVLDGLPLGTPDAEGALEGLTPDRFRAVLGVVCTITVLPIGRGRRKGVEHRDRLQIDWK
ncbi:recombinase family protein [Mycolicibacterium thermoresistibile]|nr:recombinase family protein [Mycolicibacterium thermoresistibile]